MLWQTLFKRFPEGIPRRLDTTATRHYSWVSQYGKTSICESALVTFPRSDSA